uniref:Mediator of RNA polymerase II transcription subunit 14 n=1 Tax=Kalanchoe fedtschenkoi TaxID=63787 RepID=A0A7N0T523_KALFE
MGFPDKEGSYYLLLQLDNSFKPVFQLLKCQPDVNVVVQAKMIDSGKMPLLDDELNLSLLDLEKLLPPSTADYNSNKSRMDMLSVSNLESSTNNTGWSPSKFSSFVDNVFDHLKSLSASTQSGCSSFSPIPDGNKDSKSLLKRKIDDIIHNIPSLFGAKSDIGRCNKRKGLESTLNGLPYPQELTPPRLSCKSEGYCYADCMAEADKGNASNSIYVSAFIHVVKHCSLSINYARLINQMDSHKIPYAEEIGLTHIPSNLWLHLPFVKDYSWPYLCLQLGKTGSTNWNVKINDQYFRDLGQIQKGNLCTSWGSIVFVDNTAHVDSHIHFDLEGITLSYQSVEVNSMEKLIADIHRLSNARMFALAMQKLIEAKSNQKESNGSKKSGQFRKLFKIDKVGLTSLWFTYDYGGMTRFVVEWEPDKKGCTLTVSPEHLWPHTKFLEDFVNEAEVASLLDCISLTAGPLHALAAATRTARPALASVIPEAACNAFYTQKHSRHVLSDGLLPCSPATYSAHVAPSSKLNSATSISKGALGNSIPNVTPLLAAVRVGPGMVASSLLPTDVSIVLRSPYWIQIIYRKILAIDMRCFAGDQVWLQPATPPKGGPSVGGSLSCPQFRPFIMEHVAQEINVIESNTASSQLAVGYLSPQNSSPNLASQLGSANSNNIGVPANSTGVNKSNLASSALAGSSNLSGITLARPVRKSSVSALPARKRGELNAAIVGLGDDGGYGGGWVPLVTLKKVLRSVLKYLGVLWLFSQLPDLLKEILGSILKENEGTLMNLDAEQPALRFFVGNHVFAVTVHRVQLNLQVLSMKRFQQQQPQQQQSTTSTQEELSQPEINEMCDYFSRRVASEPYDVSRVASFITLLTLPVPVLREFLKLIAWKTTGVAQGTDLLPARKPSIELSLERHTEFNQDNLPDYSTAKSNIHYSRAQNVVEFGLTAVLDASQVPHVDPSGGAAWLPYCVSVRLRYSFGENHSLSFIRMEGSHGGQALWVRLGEWQKCKKMVAQTVEASGSLAGEVITQGRLRVVADNIKKTLELCLQGLKDKDGFRTSGSTGSGRT